MNTVTIFHIGLMSDHVKLEQFTAIEAESRTEAIKKYLDTNEKAFGALTVKGEVDLFIFMDTSKRQENGLPFIVEGVKARRT